MSLSLQAFCYMKQSVSVSVDFSIMNKTLVYKLQSEKITIWLIILAAASLRFFNLGEMSLSNDELSSLVRIRYDTFSEMITKGVYIDFHPAGLQSFLFYWVKIFGENTFALRFPFVITSIISVWLIYKLGKKWYNELTALLAATAFGCLIFTILFTQLARMYSPGIMFSLFTVYFWTDYLFPINKKSRSRSWWGWIISMSVSLHLHYFCFLFVSLVGLSGLFFVKRNELLKYSLGGLFSLMTFLPEIPIFMAQMKTGDIGGWLGPPSYGFLFDFFFELFNRSILICSLAGSFLLVGILFSKKSESINRYRILSLVWFFASFSIAFLYSIFRHPILTFSTLLFVTPFLLLFIFSFVPELLLKKKNTTIVTILFLFILIYDTVVPGKYFSTKQFGVFREVAEDLQGWTKKFGVKNVPAVINVINPEYLNYYFKKMNEPPMVVADRIETPSDFSSLFQITDSSTSPYFSYIWSNSQHPPEVPGIIRLSYPYLIEEKNYFNAGSFLFGKQSSNSVVNTKLFSSYCDFDENQWPVDLSKITSERFHSGKHSQKMDVEYSASLRKKISEVPGSGYRYITFSGWILTLEETLQAQMVISFNRNDKPYDYHGVILSDFKLKLGQWQPVILAAELPKQIEINDVLIIYFWNPSNKLFYIDDLKVEIHKEVDPYQRFIR